MSVDRVVGHPDYSSAGSSKFISEIWSAKMQKKFYNTCNLTAISNTDYQNEIKNQGDTVIIRGIPDISIGDYQKGMTLDIQHPEQAAVTMLIDKGKYFNIYVDDVDSVQSDIDLLNKFTDAAGRDNAIAVETDVLARMPADAHASNYGANAGAISAGFNLGASGSPIQITAANVLDYIVDCGTVLGENKVQDEDCWMLVPEWMAGLIQKSDLQDASLSGDSKSVLRSNLLGKIGRFNILKSNLLPTVAATTDASGFKCYYVMFGHKDATSFANQYIKVQKLTSELTFAQIVRGLNVYGSKVVNSQGLGYMYVRK